MRIQLGLVLCVVAAASVSARAEDQPKKHSPPSEKITAKTKLTVTSSAFQDNGPIPAEYTCDGADKSPPLSWSKVPAGTKSIAILVEDPDAPGGTFTHWMVTDLPPTTTSLAAATALPQGAMAAKNSKGDKKYTGPCPPSGMHHFHFHVYALDMTIPEAGSKAELLATIDGHVLAEGELVGTYEKRGNR